MSIHANIPIFIPHLGCPNQCVFCNQRTISGVNDFHIENVRSIIENALSTIDDGCECEIAFFGGSFTGIERNLMLSLLETAKTYVDLGKVKSIRCSTRPDYINEEIIKILKNYGVRTVELGLQSCNDDVLATAKRGHTRKDEENACRLITDAGIQIVGQMMIGLPGSTLETELETANFIIKSGARAARIYPTVVFRETELCEMTKNGAYAPLSVDEAVKRCAFVLDRLSSCGIDVIRIGLCSSENLSSEKTYYAGPNHPALGELVENQLYYTKISRSLARLGDISDKIAKISVPIGSLSKAIGQKKTNKEKLCAEFRLADVKFSECSELSGYDFFVDI